MLTISAHTCGSPNDIRAIKSKISNKRQNSATNLVWQYLVQCVAVIPQGYSAVGRHIGNVNVLVKVYYKFSFWMDLEMAHSKRNSSTEESRHQFKTEPNGHVK